MSLRKQIYSISKYYSSTFNYCPLDNIFVNSIRKFNLQVHHIHLSLRQQISTFNLQILRIIELSPRHQIRNFNVQVLQYIQLSLRQQISTLTLE